MTEKKIREVIDKFAEEAKRIYGIKLEGLILYGSCARGDFQKDSDIDILILLNVPLEDISSERNRILDISDKLDLEYDVVLAPVFRIMNCIRNTFRCHHFIRTWREKV